MTNLSVIENRISTVKKYLKILERYKKFSRKKIEEDIDLRGAVERYLYLAVQATIDLAGAVISFKNLRKPITMSENYLILEEEKIIDKKLCQIMARMVGFRNIIAHDYGEIDYDIVYDILQNRLKDIEQFLRIIEKKIVKNLS
ncbi:MAG: type VII toxin-antitoxin system HepT family RNase toxin [Candidatus Saccharicenans sp.]|nr:MAG: DUF86 domain-containing protein [Candidatus Aminicenantes bacterium]HEK85614.1 DUF86 domain-containing protein [Candidatus Aminicenantes bacterium]